MVKKKVQLHGSTGKVKTIPKPVVPTSTPSTSTSTSTVLDGDPNSEVAQRFELELCWCIQELQTALKNGKLNPKQMEEQRKVLNTLMSTTAPLVKKRQLMRMHFGDYRAKMEAEQRKYQTQSNSNRIKVKPAVPSRNSMFIKKSLITGSGNSFTFNFDAPQDELPDVSAIKISEEQNLKSHDKLAEKENVIAEKFSYVPSQTEFKFNFEIS